MNVSALFLGPLGAVYSSSCVLVLLIVMLYMSWRLFISRRRKAYLHMAVSLILITIHYLILVILPISGYTAEAPYDFTARVLKVISFILINMAFYQLYNSTKRRHTLYFWGLMFVTLCLAIVHWRVPYVFQGTPDEVRLLQDIGLELFLFLLVTLAFFYVAPRTGAPGKYRIALGASFTEQCAYLLNRFVYEESSAILTLLERFMPVMFYMILFQLLFERIVELMHAIYRSSITDGLTGLYNRRFFVRQTGYYIKHGQSVSVIFGDIDDFKKLNDTQGHHRGDEMLRQVAQIAMEVAEDVGIAGRYGGEELAILIVEPLTDTHELAEYFRERVEQETGVTISLGHSTWQPDLSPEELIRQADKAMYQAKKMGKNKVVAYRPAKHEG